MINIMSKEVALLKLFITTETFRMLSMVFLQGGIKRI